VELDVASYKSDLCATASNHKHGLDHDSLLVRHSARATCHLNPICTTPRTPRKICPEGHEDVDMLDDSASDITADGNSPTPTADTPIIPTAVPPVTHAPPATPSTSTDPNTVLLAMMAALLKQELAPILDHIAVVETHTQALG